MITYTGGRSGEGRVETERKRERYGIAVASSEI
jgi:hypothetical protein